MIAPCLAFTQIFQLKGYGQHGTHGTIVNVPTNLDLVQIILFRLLYDDISIEVFLKRKLEHKSIYMSGYVCLNIVIKVLQELYQIPLYKSAKIPIRPNWQDLVELTNTNETTKLEEYTIDENLEIKTPITFEEVVDEDYTYTLVQNILNFEHVINDNDKSLTIVLGERFQLLGLFHDAHSKINIIFPTLFYGHPRASLTCSYQKIVQAKLINLNKKFTYHISHIYFKTIKILIHFILSCGWICTRKAKLLDRVLKINR